MARMCRLLAGSARGFVVGTGLLLVTVLGLSSGCAYVPNYFRETGPSTNVSWNSPTAADVMARYPEAPQARRAWTQPTLAAENGSTYHWPLYFEDPFEDKGHGRSDNDGANYHNVWHSGWEDYLALVYSPARFILNSAALPVSAVVTPPWTVMVSDGRVSRQLLGYDHDAIPLKQARREHPLTDKEVTPAPAPIDEQPPAGQPYNPAIAQSAPPSDAPGGGYPVDPGCAAAPVPAKASPAKLPGKEEPPSQPVAPPPPPPAEQH